MDGDTLVCGAGVARSGRGYTEAVVGSGVAQRTWLGGQAHLRRRFPAPRATTDARNVFVS